MAGMIPRGASLWKWFAYVLLLGVLSWGVVGLVAWGISRIVYR
jgi:hypothetical protein